MASAREIPGLSCDEPYVSAARRVVAVRAQELFDHSEGVLDCEDIERVHDMRVASRRLRAALEIFAPCFPPERYRSVLHDVKALADALGERRDPDVHLVALGRIADAVPAADRAGIAVLTRRLTDRQANANSDLAAALEAMRRSDLEGRLRQLAGQDTHL